MRVGEVVAHWQGKVAMPIVLLLPSMMLCVATIAEQYTFVEFDLQSLEIETLVLTDLEFLVVILMMELKSSQTNAVITFATFSSKVFHGSRFPRGVIDSGSCICTTTTPSRFFGEISKEFIAPTRGTFFQTVSTNLFQLKAVFCAPRAAFETVFAGRQIPSFSFNCYGSWNFLSAVQAKSFDYFGRCHLAPTLPYCGALMAIGIVPLADRKRVSKITGKLSLIR